MPTITIQCPPSLSCMYVCMYIATVCFVHKPKVKLQVYSSARVICHSGALAIVNVLVLYVVWHTLIYCSFISSPPTQCYLLKKREHLNLRLKNIEAIKLATLLLTFHNILCILLCININLVCMLSSYCITIHSYLL